MPRKGFTKDTSALEDILSEGDFLTLSLCDENGAYGVPVNYGYRDGKLYIHSGARGRKFRALMQDTEICFSVISNHTLVTHEKPCKWGYKFKSVVGFGKPRLLENEEEQRMAFSIIMDQYGHGKWDFDAAALESVAIFEIPVNRASARIRE